MFVGSVCIPLSVRQRPVDKQEAFLGLWNQVLKYKWPLPNVDCITFAKHSEIAAPLLQALVEGKKVYGWNPPNDILLHAVTCSGEVHPPKGPPILCCNLFPQHPSCYSLCLQDAVVQMFCVNHGKKQNCVLASLTVFWLVAKKCKCSAELRAGIIYWWSPWYFYSVYSFCKFYWWSL